ncbi:hypothetical protein ACNKHU_13080 [Shigella flexneri]
MIKSGKVTMEELDDAARHVLNVNMIWDCLTTIQPFGAEKSHPVDTNAESRLHLKKRVKWRAKACRC